MLAKGSLSPVQTKEGITWEHLLQIVGEVAKPDAVVGNSIRARIRRGSVDGGLLRATLLARPHAGT